MKKNKRWVLLAFDYLERYGQPQSPAQIATHECIIFTLLPTPFHWTVTGNQREHNIQVKGRLKSNNADAVRALVLQGAGIAVLANYLVMDDIKAGRLQ